MSSQISEQGGDESSKKRIRQAVYDIRYKARKDELDLRHAYSQYIGKSGLDQTGKEEVQNKLFGKKGEQQESLALESAGSNKYKVRVSDKETGKTYIRYAKRDKISKLRSKGSVEMTGHGSPKGAKKSPSIKKADKKSKLTSIGPEAKKIVSKKSIAKAAPKSKKSVKAQIVEPKNKMDKNETDVVGSAVQALRKIVSKEAFIADATAVAPPINKKITGEKVDNSKLIKVFPQDGSDPQIGSIKSSYKPVGEVVSEILATEDMKKGYEVTNADKKGNTPAWQGYLAGKKKKDGTPLYRKAAHMEEVGVSTSAAMEKAKKEAKLQKKEQGAVKKAKRWQDNDGDGKWYEPGVDVKKEEFADPFYKQVEYDDEDPRSMKTKWNLVKNRLRSLGLKCSNELEGDSLDESEAVAQGAQKRAEQLGAQRRQASYKKTGSNSGSPGKNERAGYNLAQSARSRNASLETQGGPQTGGGAKSFGFAKNKSNPVKSKSIGDTGATGHYKKRDEKVTSKSGKTTRYKMKFADRMNSPVSRRQELKDPKKNPKHTANEEVVLEADSLSATVDRWEAARQKRMKQRQSYERPSWIPRDQDHSDSYGSSKGEKKVKKEGYVSESNLVRNILTKKN